MVFTDWYEPGFRAGGPIRSCVNFVNHMQEDYRILIFTSDRDLDAATAYEDISADHWTRTNSNVHLYYCSPRKQTFKNIRKQMRELAPEFVYLNSMFSRNFSLYPLLVHRTARLKSKIILAPRGMLRKTAIRFKSLKKKVFLSLFRMMGFSKKIHFQATDETEVMDIRKFFGEEAKITMLTNFPGSVNGQQARIIKKVGQLRMIFIGRIHPIKNLDFLLKALSGISSDIELTIIGVLEDAPYWERCQAIANSLPSNIKVNYLGEKPGTEIPEWINKNHLLAIPTAGENFGHAIFEALVLGRPVLISDQTPWRGLEEHKAGWDLPLNSTEAFTEKINQLAGMGQDEYDVLSKHARDFAEETIRSQDLKEQYLKLFN